MLGKVSIAVKTFGVCDFSRLVVTAWRLRRWRLWFLALMTATPAENFFNRAREQFYFVFYILFDLTEFRTVYIRSNNAAVSFFNFRLVRLACE